MIVHQVLISTSGYEECRDLPTSNLVIVFNHSVSAVSFINSRRRFKRCPTVFVTLVRQDDAATISMVLDSVAPAQTDDELDGDELLDNHAPSEHSSDQFPSYTAPHSGEVLTIDDSVEVLSCFCRQLSTDRYTILKPDFSCKKRYWIYLI